MKRESNQALKVRLERLEGLVQSLNKASTRDEKSLPTVSSNSSVRRNNADQGRLVIEGDESRYIENSFWITLSNEVLNHHLFLASFIAITLEFTQRAY